VNIVTLDDYPGLPEAVEDGDTFEDNAKLKALHYARLTECWTLSDDSGLQVDALDGAPGVRSARYADPASYDTANNAKLIQELAGVPAHQRTARFCCGVALANSDEVLATASGVLEGVIIDEARGANGFGYDPHFLVPEFGMTTAQMEPCRKNRISHRGNALRAIRPAIERLVAGSG
jgi:XTP/dITP diphosphohydrolase